MNKVRVKICCINSVQEATLAVRYGAAALGLVGKMPSGPGVIDDEVIRQIVKTVPPPIATFLLSSETKAEDIIAHQKITNANTLQLVDRVMQDEYTIIREALPTVKVVQVIHVLDEASIDEALSYAGIADALLLDSGNPNLQVKLLGGTGNVHNWDISRKIVEQSSIPVFLAGGLHVGNVAEAITSVHPFGIDICSGLRTNGMLNEEKLYGFMSQVGY
ncbi:MAG: phosphoribosylanthranilate isomerase [Ignavibacteriales bacterium]|nr:phosphoribosylanthranilate isomerase [Ignavibacteriales bacterium]